MFLISSANNILESFTCNIFRGTDCPFDCSTMTSTFMSYLFSHHDNSVSCFLCILISFGCVVSWYYDENDLHRLDSCWPGPAAEESCIELYRVLTRTVKATEHCWLGSCQTAAAYTPEIHSELTLHCSRGNFSFQIVKSCHRRHLCTNLSSTF